MNRLQTVNRKRDRLPLLQNRLEGGNPQRPASVDLLLKSTSAERSSRPKAVPKAQRSYCLAFSEPALLKRSARFSRRFLCRTSHFH